jgi:threonylcarbamoyladenosine tRNA methylthiotransferase MtaB
MLIFATSYTKKRRSFIIKVAAKTLGCKVNQYETEVMLNLFLNAGYKIVSFKEKADVYIINTCTVTKEADRKSKQMIRKAIHQNYNSKIIVTGCYAQSNYQDLKKIDGINLILGNSEKNEILQQLSNIHSNCTIKVKPIKNTRKYNTLTKNKSILHTRAFVKIQDGCNRFCSYCKIPYVRGPARSRLVDDILQEISILERKGIKEVVLLGINLGTYGKDLPGNKVNLAKIISLINNFKGIKRIRLSSIELVDINNELLDIFFRVPKFCHHLHIPLQSGDNKILKLMNRPYDTSMFYEKISQIRERIPNIAITTDVMVGFPYENNLIFNNTYNFIQKMHFTKIHVFKYSNRENCLADLFNNDIDQRIKKERSKKLLDLSKKLYYNFRSKFIGSNVSVLIEDEAKDKDNKIYSRGITDNYIKVIIPNLIQKKGEIVKVKLNKIYGDYIISQIIS